MKNILFIIIGFFCYTTVFSQTKKDLEIELKFTKSKLDSFQILYFQQQSQYQQKIVYLESIIDKVKFVLGNTSTQNSTFATSPTQNNINTNVESLNSQINDIKQNTPLKLGSGDGLTPRTGAKIYTGSRGGQYYINKNGNKTYIRKKG
jgi:hypothetical protein